jgi:hypothetical protein
VVVLVWNVTWFIIITYVFIAYLIAVVRVFSDLLHDRDVGGGVKAVWMVLFVFVPVVTVVVYLIVRGDGMAERSQRRMQPGEWERYRRQRAERMAAAARVTNAPLQAQQVRGPRV